MAVDDDGGIVGVLLHRVGCGNVTPGAVANVLGLRKLQYERKYDNITLKVLFPSDDAVPLPPVM